MAFLGAILLSISSVIAVNALSEECPPLDSTSCSCEIKWRPTITCSKIKDVKTLISTLQALEGYKVDLELSDVELPKLEAGDFKALDLDISTLALVNFDVSSSDVIQFYGLEQTLKILQIDESFKRKPFSGLQLDTLQVLESVLMMDNNIGELSNNWFGDGPKTLSTIILTGNGIKSLGDHVFHALDGLQILWITGNSFSQVSRSMFPSNAKLLEKIDLSDNKIKEIPTGLFSDMPELIYVNLARNSLHTLAEDKTLLKNTRIQVEGNPLKCDKELGWICKNEVTLNINTAQCASPDSMKEYTLKVFCDIHGKA